MKLIFALVALLVGTAAALAADEFSSGMIFADGREENSATRPNTDPALRGSTDKAVFGAVGTDFNRLYITMPTVGLRTKEDAVSQTRQTCKAAGAECDIGWFSYGCAVVAGDNRAFGMSAQATLAEAKADAIANCHKQDAKSCDVKEILCAPKALEH